MGSPIPGKDGPYIETGPWFFVKGILQSPVDCSHKGSVMWSFVYKFPLWFWTSCWRIGQVACGLKHLNAVMFRSTDLCLSNPCLWGGTCMDGPDAYTCTNCPGGASTNPTGCATPTVTTGCPGSCGSPDSCLLDVYTSLTTPLCRCNIYFKGKVTYSIPIHNVFLRHATQAVGIYGCTIFGQHR